MLQMASHCEPAHIPSLKYLTNSVDKEGQVEASYTDVCNE